MSATTRIYRCSDGHYYSAPWALSLLKSIHLGFGVHFQKCPVDGRWRKANPIDPSELSEGELQEAHRHTFS
jgi:hypothetical protein